MKLIRKVYSYQIAVNKKCHNTDQNPSQYAIVELELKKRESS
jgi:hypothetical protein